MQGALFIEQKFGSFLDLGFQKISPIGDKILNFVGVPVRTAQPTQ